MTAATVRLTSLQNPQVKDVVRLRRRSHRTRMDLMLIEGYREVRRAVSNRHPVRELYICPELFQGENEPALIHDAESSGARVIACSPEVFSKLSYRDRPDGLLAVAPQQHAVLTDLPSRERPILCVAEAIEKPGNLGTILRSADAAGLDGLIVCDRCTDINNPNVVRASIGTIFTVPVVEASSADTLTYLREHSIRIVAATPHTDTLYTDTDLTGSVAIVLGTEQYGLSDSWLTEADDRVRIPMKGQADSLNVAAAASLLFFEALRQREISGA